MRYLLTLKDGSVTVLAMVPVGFRREGKFYETPSLCNANGAKVLRGSGAEVTLGAESMDVGDLTADAVPGVELVFSSVEQVLAKWASANRNAVASWREMLPGEIMDDRTFRQAWRDDGKALHVDMPAAREVWREKIREARVPLLAALDVEYQRADERGDAAAKARIAQQKQGLRDATAHPGIEAAGTPEELKLVWPLASSGTE